MSETNLLVNVRPKEQEDAFVQHTADLFRLCLRILADARGGQLSLTLVEELHALTTALLEAADG